MILFQSKLISADNTDIKRVRVIKILGASKKKKSKIGEIVRTSIIDRLYKKDIIKKKIYYSLIITTAKKIKRSNGTYIKFDQNRILTLSENLKFLGTRIYGPICKEIRNTNKKRVKYKKIISFSQLTL